VIDHGDGPIRARVAKRTRNENDVLVGKSHKNPIFDT
jgi:hypothetical protein